MKRYSIVLLLLCLTLLVSPACADNQEEAQHVFALPSNLRVIDDEAFYGTAGEVVVLRENVEFIGERAFYDIPILSDMYIPQTTGCIAENAFTDTDITIHGVENSFADQWAKEHGFRFVHEDIWTTLSQTNHLLKLRPVYSFMGVVSQWSIIISCLIKRIHIRNRKRVKDYPEMYAIDLVFP